MRPIPLTHAGFTSAQILEVPVGESRDGDPVYLAVLTNTDGDQCVARVTPDPSDSAGWAYLPGMGAAAVDRLVSTLVNRAHMTGNPGRFNVVTASVPETP